MPASRIVLFRETGGRIPFLEWLDRLPSPAVAKIRVRLERLREAGHELRRPEAAYLRDGVYELRTRLGHVNYRVLYFFNGRDVVVISHGLTKEQTVPSADIDLAIMRKRQFQSNPDAHTGAEY